MIFQQNEVRYMNRFLITEEAEQVTIKYMKSPDNIQGQSFKAQER